MSAVSRPRGYVGASGDMLAIRPVIPKLGRTVHEAVNSAKWNESASEWRISQSERAEVRELARNIGLKILPEARKLVGVSVGEPVLEPVLVPSTAWCSNLRNHLEDDVWKELSRRLSKDMGWRCEFCGRKGPQWPTECHELWVYDDLVHRQSLGRLVTLCPMCHRSYHLGRAQVTGQLRDALQHLALVNGWAFRQAEEAFDNAMSIWSRRSSFDWELDLSALRDYGIEPPTPEQAKERAALSSARIAELRRRTANDDRADRDSKTLAMLHDFDHGPEFNQGGPFLSAWVAKKPIGQGFWSRIRRWVRAG